MSKAFIKWLLLAIAGIAVAGALGTVSSSAQSDASNYSSKLSNRDRGVALASVWEGETEPDYAGTLEMAVYRSPNCGCCRVWIEHAKQHGFQVTDIKTQNMEALKQKYGVPPELASCHTTIIDGYVMEGHIPADDIKRFLASKPDAAGLAVPGMPLGSPGMEAGDRKQPFQVLSFNDRGKVKVFKEYRAY
ncbi:DUF411 domain-containing protein [Myxosarcina sp. GI1(2024)]